MPVISQGLVLHLDNSNPQSYPGSGTTWTDLSGKGNHGALQGDPPVYTDLDGGTFLFNGANHRAQLPALSLTSGITVSAWIRMDPSNINLAGSCVIERSNASHGQFRIIYFGFGAFQWVVQTVNNSWYSPGSHLGSAAHPDPAWYNVVGTYTSGAMRFYVNGILENSSNVPTGNLVPGTGYGNYIGYSEGNNINYGKGRFGTFLIYDRALSAQEVAYNFRIQGARFGASGGLAEIGRKFYPAS